MRRILLVAALVLTMGGEAEAQTPYVAGAAMQRWQAIAVERFPEACGAELFVGDVPDAMAWATVEPCQIVFDPAYFLNHKPSYRCSIVVHEYGHLAGLEHSDNPFSIMYPTAPVFGARRCLR